MKGMGFYAIILVLLVVTVSVLLQQDTAPAVTYAQVVEAFENEQVDSFVIDGNTFEATLKDNSRMEYRLPSVELFFNDLGETIRQQKADGILKDYDWTTQDIPWWASMVPYIILFSACSGTLCSASRTAAAAVRCSSARRAPSWPATTSAM